MSLAEIRDTLEEKADQIKTRAEIEASAPRIAEGRKAYREQQARDAREIEASADRIQAHKEIHEAQVEGRISPELAEKRKQRAADRYEDAITTPKEKIQKGASKLFEMLTPKVQTRQQQPKQQPAKVIQQPRQVKRIQQPVYDPFSFWDAPAARTRAPPAAIPRQAQPRSMLESELGFLGGMQRQAPRQPQPRVNLLESELGFLPTKGKQKKDDDFYRGWF